MIPKKVYVLKLSEKEFKAAFINIFNVLKQNLVKMVEDLGNISSKIETETEKKGNSMKTKLNNVSKIKNSLTS